MKATSAGQRSAFAAGRLPDVEEVREGVHAVALPMDVDGLPYSLSYVVDGGDGDLHLIDTGFDTESAWEHLVRGLERIGSSVSRVASVTATHSHGDHTGLAGRLKSASGAVVRMHEREAAVLLDGRRFASEEDGDRLVDRWGVPPEHRDEVRRTVRQPVVAPQSIVDETVRGSASELRVGARRWRVIATPGHTAGHVSIVDADAGLVFTGDHVLPVINPGIGLGRRALDDDPLGDYLASLDAVAAAGDLEVCPGHGYRFVGLSDRCADLRDHHERRGAAVRRAAAETTGASTWDVAAAMTWTGGFANLRGVSRLSALMQTEMHLAR